MANFFITATFPVLADAGLVLAYGLHEVLETRGIEREDMRG